MAQSTSNQSSDPTAALLAKVYALILSWPEPDEKSKAASVAKASSGTKIATQSLDKEKEQTTGEA